MYVYHHEHYPWSSFDDAIRDHVNTSQQYGVMINIYVQLAIILWPTL